MVKKITFIAALLFTGLVIADFFNNHALTNVSGAPAGFTGSPGDGANCVSCHGGTATVQSGWITSDVPAGGYVPGATYTITATASHSTFNRFGFQISPQNNSGALLGTLVVTNSTETQRVGAGGKYITHKTAGTTGSGNSKTWTFNWIAPAAGTGNVTFYGAFNAANNNGTQTGDVIYTSTLTVQEDLTISAPNLMISENMPRIFPNPVSDHLNIAYEASSSEIRGSLEIINLEGKLIRKMNWENINSGNLPAYRKTDVSDLTPGVYFVYVKTGEHRYMEKIIKR
jgi:hypothetical protein